MNTTDQPAVPVSQLDAALKRLASEGGALDTDAAVARFGSAW
jgi:hypothetical protein